MIDMQFSKFLHLYLFYHMVNFYSYVFENVYKIAFMCSTICACSNCGLVINSVCCTCFKLYTISNYSDNEVPAFIFCIIYGCLCFDSLSFDEFLLILQMLHHCAVLNFKKIFFA